MEAVEESEGCASSRRYFIVKERASMLVLVKGAGGHKRRTRS